MSTQIIPLTSDPNQTFEIKVEVNDKNISLGFVVRYNEIAGYWVITISDPDTDTILIDSVPLVGGDYPAANLLGQFDYLRIGSAYLIKATATPADRPDDTSLGTDFVLVWGDNPT